MEQGAAPAREARNLAPGRLRGSARPALRPVCREPAGLGLSRGARAPLPSSQEARPGAAANAYGHLAQSRGGAPRGERPDRKGRPAPRMRGDCGAPRGAPPPRRIEGEVHRPRARTRREITNVCLPRASGGSANIMTQGVGTTREAGESADQRRFFAAVRAYPLAFPGGGCVLAAMTQTRHCAAKSGAVLRSPSWRP